MRMDGQRMRIIKSFLSALMQMLYPPRCPICDEILEPEDIDAGIHSRCKKDVFEVGETTCMCCGRPLENGIKEFCYDCGKKEKVRCIRQGKAVYLYQGKIKQSLYRFKYKNRREYATFFAKEAYQKYADWIAAKEPQAIIPVPMYMGKQRRRGYNQAEVFATELSKLTGIQVDTSVVKRIKDTTPQKALNDKQRKNNLKSAFQKNKNIVQYSKVLVVDDIYTTGSTAEAVAEVLLKMHVDDVYMLSISIGKGM